MQYQLVIQFEATSTVDFERLVAFESVLANELVGPDVVDGHDFGSGEFNIFILTNDPTTTFDQAMKVFQSARLQQSVRVAYRKLTTESYVVLWPPDLKKLRVA
jgi:hypothetical protein